MPATSSSTSSFLHTIKTPQTPSPNAKVLRLSRSASLPSSRTSSPTSHTTTKARRCPPKTTSRPMKNRRRARRASARFPKNAGRRYKRNTPNSARASCDASPLMPPLPPTPSPPNSKVCTAHPTSQSVHSHPPRNRPSRSRTHPAACFSHGTCPLTRTRPRCVRTFLL